LSTVVREQQLTLIDGVAFDRRITNSMFHHATLERS